MSLNDNMQFATIQPLAGIHNKPYYYAKLAPPALNHDRDGQAELTWMVGWFHTEIIYHAICQHSPNIHAVTRPSTENFHGDQSPDHYELPIRGIPRRSMTLLTIL